MSSVNPVSEAQRHLWTIGDYPAVAQHLLPISIDLVDTLHVDADSVVLDVAVGDGNAAITAARRGAAVAGVDITPAQIERARARCERDGVTVALTVGDAEHLEHADDSFDVVMSVMGMIFAPDYGRAASEMARVCRPGGRVGLTAWAEGGWSSIWRQCVADLMPPPQPGSPQPDEWGNVDEARRRLEAAGLQDVSVDVRPFTWAFPSVDDCVNFFLSAAGPFIAFFDAMRAADTEAEARESFVGALHDANEATDGTCRLPAPYLLATGIS